MTFQRLRAEMKENKINQKRLAEKLGITEKTMGEKMKGNWEFHRDEMIIICKVFNKSMDYLFGEEAI